MGDGVETSNVGRGRRLRTRENAAADPGSCGRALRQSRARGTITYHVTMDEGSKLTVVVSDERGASTVVADHYDYAFLPAEFRAGSSFYFKAGAYCGDDASRLPHYGCEVQFESVSTAHDSGLSRDRTGGGATWAPQCNASGRWHLGGHDHWAELIEDATGRFTATAFGVPRGGWHSAAGVVDLSSGAVSIAFSDNHGSDHGAALGPAGGECTSIRWDDSHHLPWSRIQPGPVPPRPPPPPPPAPPRPPPPSPHPAPRPPPPRPHPHPHPRPPHPPPPIPPDRSIRAVYVVFSNHLDVGFTNNVNGSCAGAVINEYFHSHFPNAIRTSDYFRANVSRLVGYQYRWMTQSWLVAMYRNCNATVVNRFGGNVTDLVCPSPTELAEFERVVRLGDIGWHAFPCVCHGSAATTTPVPRPSAQSQ